MNDVYTQKVKKLILPLSKLIQVYKSVLDLFEFGCYNINIYDHRRLISTLYQVSREVILVPVVSQYF